MNLSWLRPPSWLGAIVILLVLTGGAHAQSVDWSQYIEDTPPRATSKAPGKAKLRAKAKAKPAKKAAKKGKAKARAKAKPRRK